MNPKQRLAMSMLLVVIGASCADRQAEPEEDTPRVLCAPLVVTITVDGEAFRLENSQTGLAQDYMCTCTRPDEIDDPAYRELINEMSYDACEAFVEREGYEIEQSDCQASYDDGIFGTNFPVNEAGSSEPAYCDGEAAGCGVQ